MACLDSISRDLTLGCGAVQESNLGSPVSAKIINAGDIASFTVSPATGVATITMATGKRAYSVTAINNTLSVAVALKVNEFFSPTWDVTINLKSFVGSFMSRATPFGVADDLTRAELVIAVEHQGGSIRYTDLAHLLLVKK